MHLGKHSDKSKQTCPCLQGAHSLTHGENSQIWFDLLGLQPMGFGATLFYSLASGFITMSETAGFWQVVFHLYCELAWRCV